MKKNLTMFLVMKLPTAVRRKLLNDKWLLSEGKHQGIGESIARSFSHMSFGRINKYIVTIANHNKDSEGQKQKTK